MTPVLVFDIETIPDVAGLRLLHQHPEATSDAEVAQAAGLAMFERVPVDRRNLRPSADLKFVEGARAVHLRLIINNDRQRPAFPALAISYCTG